MINDECYLTVDGDDTYPAEYGQEMVNKVLEHKADMVVGIGYLLHILKRISDLFTIHRVVNQSSIHFQMVLK